MQVECSGANGFQYTAAARMIDVTKWCGARTLPADVQTVRYPRAPSRRAGRSRVSYRMR
ncbi:hypothetical protein BO443_30575 [Burkholderia orbicola]